MIYWLSGIYAVVAVLFLSRAFFFMSKIGRQAQSYWTEDLWQINWERRMMEALPHLAFFFAMVAAPIIYCRDMAVAFAFANFDRGDEYIVAGIAWLVWGIAWFVVFLCVLAIIGTIYYRWKVAARHALQHEDLQRNREITQIAYPPEQWGRWVRVKRSRRT